MAEKLDVRKVNATLGEARQQMARLVRDNQTLRNAKARAQQEAMVIAGNVLATAEVVGMAFGMGFLRGYYGEKATIMGLPVDAATGLVLHGVAYGLGFAGGAVAHFVAANLHNLANGALATWAAASGAAIGKHKREEAAPPSPAPEQPPGIPQPPSAGEALSFGAMPPATQGQMRQLPQPQQPMWNPWGAPPNWNGIPQQQGNPMTQEELAAAMAWSQAAA